MGELQSLLYYLQFANPWKIVNQVKFCSISINGKYVTYQPSNPFLIVFHQFSNLFLHKDIDINIDPFDRNNNSFSNTILIFNFKSTMVECLLKIYDSIVKLNTSHEEENKDEYNITKTIHLFDRYYDIPYSLRKYKWKSTEIHYDIADNDRTEEVVLEEKEKVKLPKELQDKYDRISNYLSNSIQYLSNVTIDKKIPSTVKLLQIKNDINKYLDNLQQIIENYKNNKEELVVFINSIEKKLNKEFSYRWKEYRDQLRDIDTPEDNIPDISKFVPIEEVVKDDDENIEYSIKTIVKEKKENEK